MNKLLRNFIGYKVDLCKANNVFVNKNKLKDKFFNSENMDKSSFDVLVSKITDVDNKLKRWLNDSDDVELEEVLPKVLCLKTIKVDNSDFFDNGELSELIRFDNLFTNDLRVANFEKEVLLRKKEKALKELDINKAIMYVKLIDETIKKIDNVNMEIHKVEQLYNEKIVSYENLYNQFVSDILHDDLVEGETNKNTNYDKKIVNRYRVNKIVEIIVANVEKSDYYDLFESQEIKSLLGNSYFQIKQKVNKYVGTNCKSCN